MTVKWQCEDCLATGTVESEGDTYRAFVEAQERHDQMGECRSQKIFPVAIVAAPGETIRLDSQVPVYHGLNPVPTFNGDDRPFVHLASCPPNVIYLLESAHVRSIERAERRLREYLDRDNWYTIGDGNIGWP